VVILCTRCHMVEDGRLSASAERLRRIGHRAPAIYKGTTCVVEVCAREAKYKGLCNSHYYRARNNNGDPGTAPIRHYGKAK
jgi:thymidine kinase